MIMMSLTCIDRKPVLLSGPGLKICARFGRQDLIRLHEHGVGGKACSTYKSHGVPRLYSIVVMTSARRMRTSRDNYEPWTVELFVGDGYVLGLHSV